MNNAEAPSLVQELASQKRGAKCRCEQLPWRPRPDAARLEAERCPEQVLEERLLPVLAAALQSSWATWPTPDRRAKQCVGRRSPRQTWPPPPVRATRTHSARRRAQKRSETCYCYCKTLAYFRRLQDILEFVGEMLGLGLPGVTQVRQSRRLYCSISERFRGHRGCHRRRAVAAAALRPCTPG